MDPLVEVILLGVARLAPVAIHAISDALRGGKTPEQAVAEAKARVPAKLDTYEEDLARREEITRRIKP